MTNKTSYTIIGILAIIVLVLLFLFHRSNQKYNEQVNLNEAAASELITWKDKDGLNRAKIDVLTTQNTKTFLAYETADKSIKELQSEVKLMQKYLKKQGSVTIIEGETKYDTIYQKTQGDTYKSLLSGFLTDSISNNWVYSKFGFKLDSLPDGTFKIDSVKYSLKVKNKYSLTIGTEPTGFLGLGKAKPFAEIKNHNPYTETKSLRTYQVDGYEDKRFSIGPSVGMTYDGDFKPYIGIGINWALFKF